MWQILLISIIVAVSTSTPPAKVSFDVQQHHQNHSDPPLDRHMDCITSSKTNITAASFQNSPSAQVITVECVELRGAHNRFKNFKSLKTLRLVNNKFTEFPREFCSEIPTLKRLEVREQQIKHLFFTSFADISDGLETLNLDSNGLESIEPQSFARFHRLKGLYLMSNNLVILRPGMFDGLSELRIMRMTHNRLIDIHPETFDSIKTVQILDLGHNYLQTLPDEIFSKLEKLRVLALNGNAISTVSDNMFHGLINLKDLSISFNETIQIGRKAFHDLKLYEFKLNADDLAGLQKETFSGLSTVWLLLYRNKPINFEPNLFKGLTIVNNIIIYEPNMTDIDKQAWGVEKDVPVISITGHKRTQYYAKQNGDHLPTIHSHLPDPWRPRMHREGRRKFPAKV